LNLQTFEQTIAPTLGEYRVTTKGFYMKFRVQSIYKTEFPFNEDYERYFVIENNVYKLSVTAKMDINEAFKQELDVYDIIFRKTEKTTYVNVPFERFILVNEQVTDNLIIVDKDRSSETIVKKEEITVEQYEQEQMEKWSKIYEKEQEERIMREAKNMVDNSLETTQDFQDFIKGRLNNVASTLVLKGKEYTESYWLENFEDACRFKGLEINSNNLIKILDGYRLKHQVSIMKLQKDIENGKYVSTDLINEKYGDLMNYNLIEQAIILKYNNINKFSF
jgi:hypothetical protein